MYMKWIYTFLEKVPWNKRTEGIYATGQVEDIV